MFVITVANSNFKNFYSFFVMHLWVSPMLGLQYLLKTMLQTLH